jgi:dTDP-4-dehydrorhamnose 3,5-epimerase-like enzyme
LVIQSVTRAVCQHEFEVHGLKPVIAQASVNYNQQKGTLRGMDFQIPPAAASGDPHLGEGSGGALA